MKEKSIRTGILLDFYRNLLTDKMRETCESYYNEIAYKEIPYVFMENQNWFKKGSAFLKRKFQN